MTHGSCREGLLLSVECLEAQRACRIKQLHSWLLHAQTNP
jgi:hypothetical protein